LISIATTRSRHNLPVFVVADIPTTSNYQSLVRATAAFRISRVVAQKASCHVVLDRNTRAITNLVVTLVSTSLYIAKSSGGGTDSGASRLRRLALLLRMGAFFLFFMAVFFLFVGVVVFLESNTTSNCTTDNCGRCKCA